MSADIGRDVARYLNTHPNGRWRNAIAVRVKFKRGRQEWEFYGARADNVTTYVEGERAVVEGGKKAGEECSEHVYYLVGERPEQLKNQKRGLDGCKYVYRVPGDDADWYVAGWFEGKTTGEHHPFGPFFTVRRWDHDLPWMGRIDKGDEKPCVRVEMTVEVI